MTAGRCITCEFVRSEYQYLANQLATLREILHAVCGDRADELERLMAARLRAVAEGSPALLQDVDRRFTTALAMAVASAAVTHLQLNEAPLGAEGIS